MPVRLKFCLLLAFLPAAIFPLTVLANDTTAELKAGGLTYTQSPDVEMEAEDLFISRDEVRVDYVFNNTSDKDVVTYVAFPMPDIAGGPGQNIAIEDLEHDNFLGFSVTQDDKAITPELQQRAIAANGVDMTDVLLAYRIPLLPFSEATTRLLDKLPDDAKRDLVARGLAVEESFDAGQGMENHLSAQWTLRSVYWWKTTFPARAKVKVHHRYKPGVGGTVAITFVNDGKPNGEIFDIYRKRYCMDDGFVKTAIKLQKEAEGKDTVYYTENWISYILTTGANWSGPIKHFKLTVDKGNDRNYISFCGEGVKKVGPTTFEMKMEDFTPEKDLDFLLLTAPQ